MNKIIKNKLNKKPKGNSVKNTQHNNAQHRRNTYETSYRITNDDDGDGDALNINWQHLRFLALNRLLNVFCESPTPSHRIAATSAAAAAAALCCERE